MIRMFFELIYREIKEIYHILVVYSSEYNRFKLLAFFLEPGNYRVFVGKKTVLYRISRENQKYVKKYFYYGINNKWISKLPFWKIRITQNESSVRESNVLGDIVVKTITDKYKIINKKKNTITSLYSNDEMKDIEAKYNTLKEYYPGSYILSNEVGIVERYIEYIPQNLQTVDDLYNIRKYIFECCKKSIGGQVNLLKKHYDYSAHVFPMSKDEKINEFTKFLYEKSFVAEKLPIIQCHGDMTYGNVLYDGKNITFIDFECAHLDIFYYDFFSLFFVEEELLKKYFLKESDIEKQTKEIFKLGGG